MIASTRAPIFDAIDRADRRAQFNGESTFSFYNRVGGDYWEQGRALVQGWADRIERDMDYNEMRAALRGSDDAQAKSAYLELYLHEALRRTFDRLTVHPDLAGRTRHPDFFVSRRGLELYVEATLPAASKDEKAAASRVAKLLAEVDKVGDPNFFIWIEEMAQGNESPSAASLREKIRRWLRTLDPDAVKVDASAQELPKLHWEQGSWSGDIMAIPKKPSARRPSERSIGVYGHAPVQVVDDAAKLRRTLDQKARAYGNLEAPFVIAVGTYFWDSDDWQVKNALFGSSSLSVDFGTDDLKATPFRQRDGFFGAPGAWKNRRVSGVLIVNQLSPHNPLLAQIDFWPHPDAERPLQETTIFPGRVRVATATGLEDIDALDARTLFDLPQDWPAGNPWERADEATA
jgi:hypothetical protein